METEALIRIVMDIGVMISIILMFYIANNRSTMYINLAQKYIKICSSLSRIHIDNLERIMASLPSDMNIKDKEIKKLADELIKQAKETIDIIEKE